MYLLPESLRSHLAAPLAAVLSTSEALALARGREVVSVGDVVTQMFLGAGVVPRVMVVDGVTQRMQERAAALEHLPESVVEVVNPAGSITPALFEAIVRALAAPGPTLIHVNGEEDLAALPALLHAPDGALVCYGQPPLPASGGRAGVVAVEVDGRVRERARFLLSQMEVK
jgi:uncharacterized protein (UPF0218 family)